MPQTSYAINLAPAYYPGQPADGGIKDKLSALTVLAAISYGLLGVVDSSNSGGFDNLAVKVPSSSADITTPTRQLGVVMADQARAQAPLIGTAQYPRYSAVPLARVGRLWVVSETAVTDGRPVYARWTTGDNGTVAGTLGGILDTSVVGNALLSNAVWRGTYAAPGFAVVELNIV